MKTAERNMREGTKRRYGGKPGNRSKTGQEAAEIPAKFGRAAQTRGLL
jgi:hypothetical protein